DQDLVKPFFFEFSQRHPMFLEEFDEMLTRDAAILAARNPVATQSPRVEPFTHRPRRDFTNLRDLAGGKNFFHGRHSVNMISLCPQLGAGTTGGNHAHPEKRTVWTDREVRTGHPA